MKRATLAMTLGAVLAACTTPAPEQDTATRMRIADQRLPPMKLFQTAHPKVGSASNADIARDILDLTFSLESGRSLPVLTRFEGPVTVAITGNPPASLKQDLGKLVTRLRNEARIDIQPAKGTTANITIEAVTRSQIKRALPQAACFVVPGISALSEYRQARRSSKTNWTQLKTRSQVAIFVPNDVSPQELRDCLHEELAQALGPLNDLYRLPNSVFNDDNTHTVLTGFDMLILKAVYDPRLRSGMTRGQVAQALPDILDDLNPNGRGHASRALPTTPRRWIAAVQTALGPGSSISQRRNAADAALGIARAEGWQDHRLGFSHQINGRILMRSDPVRAEAHFREADAAFARAPDSTLHRAILSARLGAFALRAGDPAATIAHVKPYIKTAATAENAALLATLQLLHAEALATQGLTAQAGTVRLDSLGWARYGFGEDWAVRAKMREIASLAPRP